MRRRERLCLRTQNCASAPARTRPRGYSSDSHRRRPPRLLELGLEVKTVTVTAVDNRHDARLLVVANISLRPRQLEFSINVEIMTVAAIDSRHDACLLVFANSQFEEILNDECVCVWVVSVYVSERERNLSHEIEREDIA